MRRVCNSRKFNRVVILLKHIPQCLIKYIMCIESPMIPIVKINCFFLNFQSTCIGLCYWLFYFVDVHSCYKYKFVFF